ARRRGPVCRAAQAAEGGRGAHAGGAGLAGGAHRQGRERPGARRAQETLPPHRPLPRRRPGPHGRRTRGASGRDPAPGRRGGRLFLGGSGPGPGAHAPRAAHPARWPRGGAGRDRPLPQGPRGKAADAHRHRRGRQDPPRPAGRQGGRGPLPRRRRLRRAGLPRRPG
ncbi:MAG: hypothetical protein AVDCRST_MAG05-3159, partial [uncultured Rubrobacteraceae bacterium]